MSDRLLACLSVCLLAAAGCSERPSDIPEGPDANTRQLYGEEAPAECVKGAPVQYFQTYEGLAGQDLLDAEAECFGFMIPADMGDNTQ